MVSSVVNWIIIGLVFVCIASFAEARIDSSNSATNNFYVKENSRKAVIPASTTLLYQNDFNQPNFHSPTRDQLYRIQRHTYMFSPVGFNSISNAQLPYHFSFYDPTAKVSTADQLSLFSQKFYDGVIDPQPLSPPSQFISDEDTSEAHHIVSDSGFQPQTPSPNTKITDESRLSIMGRKSFPSISGALDTILQLQQKVAANKVGRNPTPKTLQLPKIKAKPLLDLPVAVSTKPESEQAFDSMLNQKRIKYIRKLKNKNKARKLPSTNSSKNKIDKKLLSKFKVFRAVP